MGGAFESICQKVECKTVLKINDMTSTVEKLVTPRGARGLSHILVQFVSELQDLAIEHTDAPGHSDIRLMSFTWSAKECRAYKEKIVTCLEMKDEYLIFPQFKD
jgi:hypothetical protein